MKTILCCLQ